jgi:hypothetical protein
VAACFQKPNRRENWLREMAMNGIYGTKCLKCGHTKKFRFRTLNIRDQLDNVFIKFSSGLRKTGRKCIAMRQKYRIKIYADNKQFSFQSSQFNDLSSSYSELPQ